MNQRLSQARLRSGPICTPASRSSCATTRVPLPPTPPTATSGAEGVLGGRGGGISALPDRSSSERVGDVSQHHVDALAPGRGAPATFRPDSATASNRRGKGCQEVVG